MTSTSLKSTSFTERLSKMASNDPQIVTSCKIRSASNLDPNNNFYFRKLNEIEHKLQSMMKKMQSFHQMIQLLLAPSKLHTPRQCSPRQENLLENLIHSEHIPIHYSPPRLAQNHLSHTFGMLTPETKSVTPASSANQTPNQKVMMMQEMQKLTQKERQEQEEQWKEMISLRLRFLNEKVNECNDKIDVLAGVQTNVSLQAKITESLHEQLEQHSRCISRILEANSALRAQVETLGSRQQHSQVNVNSIKDYLKSMRLSQR